MKSKVLEIRDDCTLIPVLAIEALPENAEEFWALRRSGYDLDPAGRSVIVVTLTTMKCEYSPHHWSGGCRTMRVAHLYIKEHFDELQPGDVVDVEYILGTRETPKISERLRQVDA